VAEIENMGAGRDEPIEDALDLVVEARSAGDERQRIEVALQREPPGQGGVGGLRLDRRVEADRVDADEGGEFRQLGPGAARKSDDGRLRRLGPDLGRERRHRRDAPAIEFGRGQHAGPGIEDLHRFRARRQLTDQVFGRGVDEPVDQGREQVRMAIGEEARRRLIRRPAPGDHIARHRPRGAAEADQRHVARQCGLEAVESFEHGRKPVPVGLAAELRQALSVADRVEARAVARFKGDALAERVRQDENVGEQDRTVEAEPADRLQRRLDGEGGVIAKIEKGRGFRPKIPVFRQIAPRLAHEPDRRRRLPLAGERGEERLASPNPAR
jgi:hypothetical protein